MAGKPWSPEDRATLAHALEVYGRQLNLIWQLEFQDRTLPAVENQCKRITVPKGAKPRPLRIETHPEEVAATLHELMQRPHSKLYTPDCLVDLMPEPEAVEIPNRKRVRQPEQEVNQIDALRKRVRDLEAANRNFSVMVGEQTEATEQVTAAVVGVDPYPRYKYTPRKGISKTPVVPVFVWSDWHVGEVIRAEETEGFGEYNWDIAQDRFFRFVENFLHWVEVQRNAYRIETCQIFALGDYISGDIHQELLVTNEFPSPVQTAKAGHLMGEGLRRLAPHFQRVDVAQCGADNHGRLTRKPQAKQKAVNNYSFLVHTIANVYVERCDNIRVQHAEGIKLLAEVAGWRFLLEHGDLFKSWMGIPFYGIQRGRGREAVRRMNTDLGFHYQTIGHWHVPTMLEGSTIINGSLSGTSEFDHGAGRHANPAQVAFMVHPTRGLFNMTTFTEQMT